MRLLVVGFGEMGHAMQALLGEHHQLLFYDIVPLKQHKPLHLESEATLADAILLCVPAEPHQQLLETLLPHLNSETVTLSIAKGLDHRGRTPGEIYAATFGSSHAYALLYGPMIAEELRADRDGFADLWCSTAAARKTIHRLFSGSRLHLRDSDDMIGISWAVVLKNVYAMAFGLADGLELGVNVRGFLAVTAQHELSEIVREMGGNPSTPTHLAGLGDLITTATSRDSHHHALGEMLARGESRGITGEGPHTLQTVQALRLFEVRRYPLFSLIGDIVSFPERARELFLTYLEKI